MLAFLFFGALLAGSAGVFIFPTAWRVNVAGAPASWARQRLRFTGALLVVAGAVAGIYWRVGNPGALIAAGEPTQSRRALAADGVERPSASATASASGPTPAQVQAMVNRLEGHLKAQPDDAQGWQLLARTYETLGRPGDAVQAYWRLFQLTPPGADLLADYAVAQAMSAGQTLTGEPEAALKQALKLNPAHQQALALSGSAAFERQDYTQALAHWGKLLSLLAPDAPMRAAIEGHVAKAKALATRDGQAGSAVSR